MFTEAGSCRGCCKVVLSGAVDCANTPGVVLAMLGPVCVFTCVLVAPLGVT